jgi:hypothetical protein
VTCCWPYLLQKIIVWFLNFLFIYNSDVTHRHGLHIRRTGHNTPRGPSAGWWVLTTVNVAGINGLTCLPKHGEVQDNKFLVTHSMTDLRCLTSVIARRSALTAGPSSSSYYIKFIRIFALVIEISLDYGFRTVYLLNNCLIGALSMSVNTYYRAK